MATLDQARAALRSVFGYPDFRAGQVDVVRSVVEGNDTLAVLPTGGGKSLCYQVPALVLPGLTVVVSPLISLMQDQVDRLLARGVSTTLLNSTLDRDDAAERIERLRSGRLRLLYVAPERLESGRLQAVLASVRLALLAVDEAHCISEWGHEFRPSYRRIAESCRDLAFPRRLAVTATATPVVRRDIVRQLQLRAPRVVVAGFDRPNLSYAVERYRDEAQRTDGLLRTIRTNAMPAIVYGSTRATVQRVANRLRRAGVQSGAYHGGLLADERRAVQARFMAGSMDCLVATNAFGMGIDKPDVRLVVHVTTPGTLEGYYQEAGRAGRDGRPGRCVLLHTAGDRDIHEHFIRSMIPEEAAVRRAYERLRTAGPGILDLRELDPAVVAFLIRSRVLSSSRGHQGAARVRVLASELRVGRELPPDSAERRVIDAIRALDGGPALVTIGFGALSRLSAGEDPIAVLRRLRDRQFLYMETPGQGIRLARPGAALDEFSLDWVALRGRAAAERARLDAMWGYVTTTACRRACVLRYFGERVHVTRCGGCDNCLRR